MAAEETARADRGHLPVALTRAPPTNLSPGLSTNRNRALYAAGAEGARPVPRYL